MTGYVVRCIDNPCGGAKGGYYGTMGWVCVYKTGQHVMVDKQQIISLNEAFAAKEREDLQHMHAKSCNCRFEVEEVNT